MSVFVITSGEHDDYTVHAVVDGTREEAEALIERTRREPAEWGAGNYGDGYRIEELPVVRPDVEKVSVLHLSVNVWDDGRVTDYGERTRIEWPFDSLYGTPPVYRRWVRAPIHRGGGGRLDVHGTDHERVRKVYSDMLAALRTDDALRARVEFTAG